MRTDFEKLVDMDSKMTPYSFHCLLDNGKFKPNAWKLVV